MSMKLKDLLRRQLFWGATVGTALIFIVIGIMFWGGFNWAMEMTNTEEFCISCHEMKDNVYEEYKSTVHYSNRSGVRATCPDCHVPKEWTYKIMRKIQASNELLHKALGSIDTREKFEAKRLQLAKNEWKRMKKSNSRECRNCHNFEYMSSPLQKPRARKQHTNAMERGQTCIDCHKGIAHHDVRDLLTDEELDELEAANPNFIIPEGHLLEAMNDYQRAVAEKELKGEEKAPECPAPVVDSEPCIDSSADQTMPAAGVSSAASSSGIDWSAVPAREIVLMYPGTASIEWILGRNHGGKNAFTAGDRCVDCHDAELPDVGSNIVSGSSEDLEQEGGIPGKRGSIPVNVQAQYDDENLYLRLQWPDAAHVAMPGVEGGKMDAENPMKLALMFATDEVEYAAQSGCWGTCHQDARNMPDAPEQGDLAKVAGRLYVDDGVTKYIKESRTKINLKTRGGAKLGGWDKLKDEQKIQAALDQGLFMDLIRYKSGSKLVEDGYILEQRIMEGGQGAEVNAVLSGGLWTVEVKRKLASNEAGDISFAKDQVYNFGFAIHDDHSNARYHHVSLGYKLGFDNGEVEVNAVRKK